MRLAKVGLVVLAAAAALAVAIYVGTRPAAPDPPAPRGSDDVPAGLARATFGAGCFWCSEAVFRQLRGVRSAVPGYSGGTVPNPTYRQVCTGTTGHAEVVQVDYDPAVISYDELLEVFWQTHDPTTPNRQGNDVGTQYRSAIFYHSLEQKQHAEQSRQQLDASGRFAASVVTEIVPFTAFYRAENYHQNFYDDNARHPYCRVVIRPKLDKMRQAFPDKLR